MEYLKVRGLEKPVARIICGTTWLPLNEEAYQMMDLYIENGGNMFDTARIYQVGKSEQLVGEWLRRTDMRKDVMITSKCCHYPVLEGNVHLSDINRVKPENVAVDLEFDLNNIGTDYLDIYMMHRDDVSIPVGEFMDALEEQKQAGRIRVYGVSNWTIPRIEEAIEYTKKKGYSGIAVNSPSFTLATARVPRWYGTVYADYEYAAWHRGKDIPLLSWGPNGGGFFTGRFPRSGEGVPQNAIDAFFTEENFEKQDRCAELAKIHGVEPWMIAQAYILCQDFPVAAIIGPRRMATMKTSFSVLDVKLTKQEMAWLRLAADSYN